MKELLVMGEKCQGLIHNIFPHEQLIHYVPTIHALAISLGQK